MTTSKRALVIRSARETDLDDIEQMVDDFVKGHLAETHARARSKLREAYFGSTPVGQLVIATPRVREAGGEFLHGGGNRDAESLYERVAMGWNAHECYVSAEAFQALADLAGLLPRDIVRRLPGPELNKVTARARG